MNRHFGVLWLSIALATTVACGGEQSIPSDAEQTRTLPAQLGGKFDLPKWLRMMGTLSCGERESYFSGYDSSHSYRFAAEAGHTYRFALQLRYSYGKGAAVAVYEADSGQRLALDRDPAGSAASTVYTAERDMNLILAVYSTQWWVNADYTLNIGCEASCTINDTPQSCEANTNCRWTHDDTRLVSGSCERHYPTACNDLDSESDCEVRPDCEWRVKIKGTGFFGTSSEGSCHTADVPCSQLRELVCDARRDCSWQNNACTRSCSSLSDQAGCEQRGDCRWVEESKEGLFQTYLTQRCETNKDRYAGDWPCHEYTTSLGCNAHGCSWTYMSGVLFQTCTRPCDTLTPADCDFRFDCSWESASNSCQPKSE